MISILCPTRNRLVELDRMVRSLSDVGSKNVEVLAYLDDDDPRLTAYQGHFANRTWPFRVDFKIGPRVVLTQAWNELVPLATGDIFMQGNDDIIFRTPGWEEMVEAAFAASEDKILMVHGSDAAIGKENFAPHPLVHRRWVDALGYFIPPYFSSDYGDTWVNDLANQLGRRKYLPFVVEHMHFCFGKADQDATTNERLARGARDNVSRLYESMKGHRAADAKKLRELMGTSASMEPGAAPVWSILILTQPTRARFLERLLAGLRPQLMGKPVELIVKDFDPELDLGQNRTALLRASIGKYVCFVDDDDLVAETYVASILPVLEKGDVDYVGFQLQCYTDGKPLAPTYHSLRYDHWYSDDKGHYRHLSHLNPIRRELALVVPLEGGAGEDHRWADRLYEKKIVKKEKYINKVMYHYYHRTDKTDGIERRVIRPKARAAAAELPWRPVHMMCPLCKSTCVVKITNGLRCQQCAHQFR